MLKHTLNRIARLGTWLALGTTVDVLARRGRHVVRPRSVLIVRLDGIGDLILWQPAAARLRELYPAPEFRLTLVTDRACAPLASSLGLFDEVWPVDYRRLVTSPLYRYRALRSVRAAGFDVAINPVWPRDLAGRGGPLWGDALVAASHAPTRVAPRGRPGLPWAITDRAYTRLTDADPGPLHELLRNAELPDRLGAPPAEREPPSLPVAHDRPPGLPDRPYFVIFPGSRLDAKRWPASRFAEVARRLHRRTGWAPVLCGGPGERELARSIARLAPDLPFADLAGATSLAGLVRAIADARALVSNDTAAAHVAAAVGTPAVAVLGGGHHGRCLPYPDGLDGRGPRAAYYPMPCFGCGWECHLPRKAGQPFPCIQNVSVDLVWQQISEVLNLANTGESPSLNRPTLQSAATPHP